MATTDTRQRDGWRRPVAMAVGLLFLAASGVATTGLHACPHHGHGPTPAQQGGPDTDGAGHAPAPSGPCVCVGACHAGAATPALADGVGTGFVDAPTRRLSVDVPRDGARVPDAYLLPYPNGPPVSS